MGANEGVHSYVMPYVDVEQTYSHTWYVLWTEDIYETSAARLAAKRDYKLDVQPYSKKVCDVFDEKWKKIATRTLVFYNKNGKVIDSIDVEDYELDWGTIIPGTMGELMRDWAQLIYSYQLDED